VCSLVLAKHTAQVYFSRKYARPRAHNYRMLMNVYTCRVDAKTRARHQPRRVSDVGCWVSCLMQRFASCPIVSSPWHNTPYVTTCMPSLHVTHEANANNAASIKSTDVSRILESVTCEINR